MAWIEYLAPILVFLSITCLTDSNGDASFGGTLNGEKHNLTRPRLYCNKMNDCLGCVKAPSWGGANCRWCPVDKACHAYGSIKNPCTEAQCINSTSRCSSILPVFDPLVAWKNLVLSSAAYSDDPQRCLNNAPLTPPHAPRYPPHRASSPHLEATHDGDASPSFVVVDRISSHCDMLGNKCFAYTAVSRELGVISLSFRGTHAPTQLIIEILETMVAPRIKVLGGKVQRYFMSAFNTLWPCAKKSVQRLVQAYPDFKVFVTGHSLGGALANIAASILVDEGIVTSSNILQYTFGEPRVGNFDYAYQHDVRVNNSWRVVHYRDIVPHIPLCLDPFCSGTIGGPYQHGIEIFYDSIGMNVSSPYQVCQGNPHNEDFGCSNGRLTKEPCIDINDCIAYHLSYYGVLVTQWPQTECRVPGADPSWRRLSDWPARLRDVIDGFILPLASSSPRHRRHHLASDIDYSDADAPCQLTPSPTAAAAKRAYLETPPPPPSSGRRFLLLLPFVPLFEWCSSSSSSWTLFILLVVVVVFAVYHRRFFPRGSATDFNERVYIRGPGEEINAQSTKTNVGYFLRCEEEEGAISKKIPRL